MSAEEDKAVVRRLFEALNSRDDAVVDELVAPDCQIIGPAGSGQGPSVYKHVFDMLRSGLPDFHVTIDEIVAAEGDRVIVRSRTHGTHAGLFMGISPTNKVVSWVGVNFFGLRGGRIASSWGLQDRLAAFESMGVVPQPAQVQA